MTTHALDIVNLCDKTTCIPQVAEWIYGAFIDNLRQGISLHDITQALSKRQKHTLPLTYIGIIGDECLGTISLVRNDLRARQDLTPWLAALYIRPDARGHGYAQQLIATVCETANTLGYHAVYLRTETAAQYYTTLGWQKIDETIDEFNLFTEVFTMGLQ
jgi:GNAT superfamily N-acetyltransferase